MAKVKPSNLVQNKLIFMFENYNNMNNQIVIKWCVKKT